jgi:hypothetical protein
MFVEVRVNNTGSNTGSGISTFANLLDYVLAGNQSSLTNAQNNGGFQYFNEWSNENPGAWDRRETNGNFTSTSSTPGHYFAWSQKINGKLDQAFFHKGFAFRWNSLNANANNAFGGYMGSFQSTVSRTTFGAFDFGRSLNWAYTTNINTGANFAALNSNLRYIYQDNYIIAAAEGYMFIGNIDQGTFWAVTDGTALPIHQYTSSSSIPMIGLSGSGVNGSSNTRHDLTIHVHKYDTGSGSTYNQLSSFYQQVNSDNAAAPNTTNFLNLYPSSLINSGFLDRFDEDGKKTTALYPIIVGNPIKGNAYQTVEGIIILSGQGHQTGQTFYVGSARYYKFVCTHDRVSRAPAYSGLTIGIPIR